MKNYLSLILAVLFYQSTTNAQDTQRNIMQFNDFSEGIKNAVIQSEKGLSRTDDSGLDGYYILTEQKVPIKADPFLAFSMVWEAENWTGDNAQIWYRFYENVPTESEWVEVHIDGHARQVKNRWISELMFEEKSKQYFDLKIILPTDSPVYLGNIDIHFYSPGQSTDKTGEASPKSVTCICPQPDFETRADWCPTGNCPPNPDPTPTAVSHLIIHHSAGTNVSSDWAGVVRSIWDYHVNTNGWADIGYNWLVDPNGVLYEGRGDDIQGAHFCGTNSGTMGVCVMGDFTDVSPSNEAKSMLTDLLSWKICDIDVDPLGVALHDGSGLELNHISGHQDGCSTQCPGNTFYPELPTIRNNVSDNIENNCTIISLQAPTNLTATVISAESVELNWQDNSTNETEFVIERSINNNSNYQEIASTGVNVETYLDENLMPNTAYFYRVKAANAQDESGYSNEVGVATVFTNIGVVQNEAGIQVFPNPVKDVLNIEVTKEETDRLSFQLMNYTGKLVREDVLKAGTYQINMGNLPKGIYILKFSNGKSMKIQF